MSIAEVIILPMTASGGDEMIKGDQWHEIHTRHRLHESKKSIARALGLDVRTVRKILSQKEPVAYTRTTMMSSILNPWKEHIRQRVAAVGYCAQSMYEELQGMGYSGTYDTVKRFVRPLRQEANLEATMRFETPPGRQGQADWGQCWTLLDGKRVKAHLFVLTLSFSRGLFVRATVDEKLPTFIHCHIAAFDHFGGLPHEILYDNPKTVVVSRDFEGRSIRWNAAFWDFARYYGFRPRLHRPYRPQTKGKVESGVKYVKRFLRGKAFASLDHLNESLLNWITTAADQRIHGTTHRKPAELFLEERDLLLDHQGKPPYTIQERVVRQVSRDCMVAFETNRYSVPFRYAGKQVDVQAVDDRIHVYHDGQLVVSHTRCEGTYQNRINKEHYWGLFRRDRLPATPAWHPFRPPPDEDVEIRDLAFYEAVAEGGAR
jgi:transposase